MARISTAPAPKTRVKQSTKATPARAASLPKHKFALLTLIDGRTSVQSYAVVAQAGIDKAIAIRDFHSGRFNVKFYGKIADFGLKQSDLREKYQAGDYLERSQYERMYFSEENLTKFLADLKSLKLGPVATLENGKLVLQHKEPKDDLVEVFKKPNAPSKRVAKPVAPVKKTARKSAPAPVSTRKPSGKAIPVSKKVAVKKVAPKPVAKAPVKVAAPVAKITTRKKFDPLK